MPKGLLILGLILFLLTEVYAVPRTEEIPPHWLMKGVEAYYPYWQEQYKLKQGVDYEKWAKWSILRKMMDHPATIAFFIKQAAKEGKSELWVSGWDSKQYVFHITKDFLILKSFSGNRLLEYVMVRKSDIIKKLDLWPLERYYIGYQNAN